MHSQHRKGIAPNVDILMWCIPVHSHPLLGGNMKYILLAVVLLLSACDKPSVPKIAEPQREVLEKAKGVNQAVQQNTEEEKKKIEDASK
jgi:hypothetical protein